MPFMDNSEKVPPETADKIISILSADFSPSEKKVFNKFLSPSLVQIILSFNPSDLAYDNVVTVSAIKRYIYTVNYNLKKFKITNQNRNDIIRVDNQLMLFIIYKIDETEDLLISDKLDCFYAIEETIIKLSDLSGTPIKAMELFTHFMKVLSRLIVKNKENQELFNELNRILDADEPECDYYYCQTFNSKKVEYLYDLLVQENLLEQNLNPLEIFQVHIPDQQKRVRWLGENTQLIYLCFLIFNGEFYISEPLHDIIPRLFVDKDFKGFDKQKLNTQYLQIKDKISDEKYLTAGLRKIKNIFDSVT